MIFRSESHKLSLGVCGANCSLRRTRFDLWAHAPFDIEFRKSLIVKAEERKAEKPENLQRHWEIGWTSSLSGSQFWSKICPKRSQSRPQLRTQELSSIWREREKRLGWTRPTNLRCCPSLLHLEAVTLRFFPPIFAETYQLNTKSLKWKESIQQRRWHLGRLQWNRGKLVEIWEVPSVK